MKARRDAAQLPQHSKGKSRLPMVLLSTLVWLGLWQFGSLLISSAVLLPGPWETVKTLVAMAQAAGFWMSLAVSVYRILVGFLLALFFAMILAPLCHRYAVVDTLLSPIRQVIRSTPVSSFIILVLLWLPIDGVPVFIVFLIALPVLWGNLQQGLAAIDPELDEMVRVYRFDRWRRWRYLLVPSLKPYLLSGAVTALGLSWKAGVAAEVIAKPALSIGRHLQDAKVTLQTEELLAWTLVVILFSLLFDALLGRLMRRGKGAR